MNKFSILLLDDVSENIYSLKLLIEENFDINIFTALKAQEAIEIVMNNTIDLILTDIQMPDVDGFEFAQYLKDVESTKNIPVIFITGIYEKDEYKNKGYNLGAIEYIVKPIDNKLLISKLKIYINIFNTIKASNDKLSKVEDLLIYSAKMASMGEMIGLISHQLKQPLNVLSLYVEDINLSYEYKELNDKYMEDFYKNTKDQIEYMNKTINGFLDFFNPNKKKENFLIKNSIYQSIEILKSKIDKLEVIFHLNIDRNLELFGVEVELTQVLINIINNSLDAFEEKKIKTPEIFIKLFKKDNKSILIIEDNALGVENNQLEKILEPYFTTKDSGTGVGLHMVKMIIKNSFDGELKVLNTQRGLSFIIFL